MSEVRTDISPLRGTQSFLYVLRYCRNHPSLLSLELLWRWLFGIPYCYLLYIHLSRLYLTYAKPIAKTGIWQTSIIFPGKVAVVLTKVYDILAAPIFHLLIWIIPLGIVVWAIFSGIGRNIVLRRYDKSLPRRWGSLIVLQFLRALFYIGAILFWFAAIRWSAKVALWSPSGSIVEYCMMVIVFSLGTFATWALVSWALSVAPILVLLERRGPFSALARSVRLGPLTAKLVEINMIMGLIKLAMSVLALVWSAIPLPFEAIVQGNSLYAWWAVGSVLYCILSDFFQIARITAFVDFWHAFNQPKSAPAHSTVAIAK
ncbi:MAG TPA: hypothetical protein VMU92_04990 [Acidobacteriaceae bacterium]|nr:hypothetical protein [Acidobacteriaceae bacterium]